MAKDTVVPLTSGEIKWIDAALAVLCDVKRRAANAPRNSDAVREAFNTELREVERVRAKVNSMELPL